MIQFSKFALVATLGLALAFTFSCSSGGVDNPDLASSSSGSEQYYKFCIKGIVCEKGSFTISTCDGEASNRCPEVVSSSSNPDVLLSSSDGGVLPSSGSVSSSSVAGVVSSSSIESSSSTIPPSSSSSVPPSSSSTIPPSSSSIAGAGAIEWYVY